MEDRDVMVTLTIKASQIEGTKRLFKVLAEFPTIAWNHADQLSAVCKDTGMSPDQSKAIGDAEQGMKMDAELAESLRRDLVPIFATAVIHDPEGRKGPLQ